MKLKKSHKWEDYEAIDIRCPHCGVWETYVGVGMGEGNIIECPNCMKRFELGRQK